ncbi:MAG TPA: cell division protein ZapA [Candidatus Hydrogenedentes bacterium]|jgi:cell division protein ZapA (FtsZ GTPase activity inhibitor)|nr:cell division protein ZapA [Candidatus Hydrogenedentota bacterium]
MMTPTKHRTTVAGVSLNLPVYGTPEETEELATLVTERIKQIESDSTRIDTQAYALSAAVHFAAEASQASKRHQDELDEIATALTALLARLNDIIRRFAISGAVKPQ